MVKTSLYHLYPSITETMKRILIALFILVLIFGGVFGWKYFVTLKTREFMAGRTIPPKTVAAIDATTSTWQPSLDTTGELQAINRVQVSSEVAGMVNRIYFEPGERVEKGEILARLESSLEEAEMERLQAFEQLSQIQLNRIRPLVENKASPQAELDKAKAEHKQALASLDHQKSLLSKKIIKAPFSGELGLREVDPGQYLEPGTPLVTLQSLAPLYLNFSIPQKNLELVSSDREVVFTVDTWPDQEFRGAITAIDPQIQRGSRSLNIQATLANKERKLRPGMFGRVSMLLPEKERVVTIPETAIDYNPYGDVVFVLTPLDEEFKGAPVYKASRKFVVLGGARGSQVAVSQGLEPGEKVVIAGRHKLREGVKAVIDNSITPVNSANPQLKEE